MISLEHMCQDMQAIKCITKSDEKNYYLRNTLQRFSNNIYAQASLSTQSTFPLQYVNRRRSLMGSTCEQISFIAMSSDHFIIIDVKAIDIVNEFPQKYISINISENFQISKYIELYPGLKTLQSTIGGLPRCSEQNFTSFALVFPGPADLVMFTSRIKFIQFLFVITMSSSLKCFGILVRFSQMNRHHIMHKSMKPLKLFSIFSRSKGVYLGFRLKTSFDPCQASLDFLDIKRFSAFPLRVFLSAIFPFICLCVALIGVLSPALMRRFSHVLESLCL